MKTKTFFSLAFILITGICFSQTYVTQIKSSDTKKWGYANQKGEIIIAPQFERCDEFTSDGWAAVYDKKNKSAYFINLKGEKLNSAVGIADVMDGFNSGLAAVKTGDKWGYLDTNGKLAIPAKYDEATAFDAGYAIAKSGNKYVVLNAHGEESSVEGSGILDAKHFSEKLAPFRASDKKFGFINERGKVAIPAKFQSVGYFKNGLAW
ncbi:MAG TPA: WG repeat-containing protein, partial [Cyclobacteriaceae bacterium]|nr:WG repeat-containing protein [Cyclobacteriaceae bacterium]